MTDRLQAKRALVAVLVVPVLMLSVVALHSLGSGAATTFSFTRLAGTDRYDTARAIAESTFGTSTDVVLTTGETFPDALAGGYAAGLGKVPILLTNTDHLAAATATALQDLHTQNVLILGGTNAVSAAVENDLHARGLATRRIAGTDRFDTAKQVAESGGAAAVGSFNSGPAALVASGSDQHFPDALAAAPISYANHFPTLLTNIDSLSPSAQSALSDLGIKTVFVPGGPAAVSDNVVAQMQQQGITVQRLAGADRTATAAAIASYEQDNLGFKQTHVNMARGDAFPDSLTGGPHAGHDDPAPILLTTNPTDLGGPTTDWLANHAQRLIDGHLFGGPAAISDAVKTQAETTVRGNSVPACTSGTTAAPTTVAGATSTTGASTSTTACLAASSTTSSTTPASTTTTVGTTTSTAPPACSPGPAPFCFPPNPLPGGGSTTSTSTSTTSTTSASTTTSTTPPNQPKLVSATTTKATGQITLTYNVPLLCSSVDGNASDYTAAVTAGPAASLPLTAATCSPTAPTTVTLTIGNPPFQSGQVVQVTAQKGTDGDTVSGVLGGAEAVGDSVIAPAVT